MFFLSSISNVCFNDNLKPSTLICVLLVISAAGYGVVNHVCQKLHKRRFAKAHNCASPPRSSNLWLVTIYDNTQLFLALISHGFLDYLQTRFRKFGNTLVFNITVGQPMIWTMDPENVEAILSTDAKYFRIGANRIEAMRPLFGHSIFTSHGAPWAQHRGMVRPSFSKTQTSHVDIFERHFSNLLKCIPQDNSTFDLRELFGSLTMDIGTEFMLGCSSNSLLLRSIGKKEGFTDAWNAALSWMSLRNYGGAAMAWVPHASFFKACDEVHSFIDRLVQRSLAAKRDALKHGKVAGGRYIFLHEIANDITDRVSLRDHALSVLIASRDTTSELLSCTINMLVRHPDLLALLRKEVGQLNGLKPTAETLKGMKFLKNVLLEVSRLFPVAPVNAMVACRDTTLPSGGGPHGKQPVMVSKGQQVLFFVYGLQRRKDIYGPDADEFVPSRWDHRRHGGWDYLPFSKGPRDCIGQSFAMEEVSYVLVRFLQEFEVIEGRESRPWQEDLKLILTNTHGTLVGLTPMAGAGMGV